MLLSMVFVDARILHDELAEFTHYLLQTVSDAFAAEGTAAAANPPSISEVEAKLQLAMKVLFTLDSRP
jgi:hypothetical protein